MSEQNTGLVGKYVNYHMFGAVGYAKVESGKQDDAGYNTYSVRILNANTEGKLTNSGDAHYRGGIAGCQVEDIPVIGNANILRDADFGPDISWREVTDAEELGFCRRVEAAMPELRQEQKEIIQNFYRENRGAPWMTDELKQEFSEKLKEFGEPLGGRGRQLPDTSGIEGAESDMEYDS